MRFYEDLEDRYNDILQKEQANYDSALIYKNDLQSWNQYNDPNLGVFSGLIRPGSNYQQNLDIWEDYYNDDMQRHNVDMAIWNEYLEKTEYPENVASWDNGQPVMNSYSSDSSPWQPPSINYTLTRFILLILQVVIIKIVSRTVWNMKLFMYQDIMQNLQYGIFIINILVLL